MLNRIPMMSKCNWAQNCLKRIDNSWKTYIVQGSLVVTKTMSMTAKLIFNPWLPGRAVKECWNTTFRRSLKCRGKRTGIWQRIGVKQSTIFLFCSSIILSKIVYIICCLPDWIVNVICVKQCSWRHNQSTTQKKKQKDCTIM